MQHNLQVRKIAAVTQTHRQQTLNAISEKAHSIDSRIEYLNIQGDKARKLLEDVPDDTASRLNWINQQLNG
ncbi:MAG: hypothetical protein WC551_06555 [Patescibacteria group bacterium]